MTDDGAPSTTPDTPPGSSPKKPSGCGIGCGVFLAIALVLLLASCIGGAVSGSGGNDNDNRYEAIAQCEARIERLLKSPGTAEFDSDATGAGTWTVTGTVDSENGFGAMLRSNFQCTVEIGEETATTTVDYLE